MLFKSYEAMASYLQQQLPWNSKMLKWLRAMSPTKIKEPSTVNNIEQLCKLLPRIISSSEVCNSLGIIILSVATLWLQFPLFYYICFSNLESLQWRGVFIWQDHSGKDQFCVAVLVCVFSPIPEVYH